MESATKRALRPGRRVLIQFPGRSATWHERMLLAVVADSEWFCVQPDGKILLLNLETMRGVRMVPAAGGRPPGLTGTVESFKEAPTDAQRRAWIEEGVLHAELELERRGAIDKKPDDDAETSVLPRQAGGPWPWASTKARRIDGRQRNNCSKRAWTAPFT